jgi:hypothetical protein
LDIKAPDLPRPRGLMSALCSQTRWGSGDRRGWRLSRLAAIYRFFAWISSSRRPAWRTPGWSSCQPVSNEIEFGCLNWNLMAPKWHRLTLAFDGNSRETDNVLSFVHTTARSRYCCRAIYAPAEQTN